MALINPWQPEAAAPTDLSSFACDRTPIPSPTETPSASGGVAGVPGDASGAGVEGWLGLLAPRARHVGVLTPGEAGGATQPTAIGSTRVPYRWPRTRDRENAGFRGGPCLAGFAGFSTWHTTDRPSLRRERSQIKGGRSRVRVGDDRLGRPRGLGVTGRTGCAWARNRAVVKERWCPRTFRTGRSRLGIRRSSSQQSGSFRPARRFARQGRE